ncbi:cobalamin biosynthesis protein CbiB [Brachyspira aalborgi]|jgi:adenosylcobinamide-phosphate synthase|uniref:Cobalamin biosynthesis protein CbiB n=1 Tax=Brachyspira aalborgi TaxID=29522 RepID=A0A5C8D4G2_9SPIR|nr:cobalamin biosynthesis protein [Brachyspira aalborgi]MBS4763435.1 cobalamin biosynthesis protein [Brachyspira sp.]CCY77377.1 cobalamin biosynthesis protein B [Brachyspira sp. CAG:700]TXJ14507.1 cobalamin biosynthesis protein CbiB [Brachyspira aalborgi]TXJ19271.1 cobalamin biosynthesis protein CbiB [Brachyspira aalborgi]TXJ25438.1 cobalamin biosynthesis protein CbiB [Brachyspira aalborgi]
METLLILPISFLMDMFINNFKLDIFAYIKNLFDKINNILHEKVYKENKILEFIFGTLISIFIIVIVFLISFYLLKLFYRIHFIIGLIIELILFYNILETRKPLEFASIIFGTLQNNNFNKARNILKENLKIDTEDMDEETIIKRTIEYATITSAENSIYLLILFIIGGIPICFLYKTIYTLSKNEVAIDENKNKKLFEIFLVKLCFIINIILSLISFLFYAISSLFLQYRFRNSFAILKKDAKDSKSILECAIAGSLDIEIGGDYFKDGELFERENVGDYMEELNYKLIEKVNKILLLGNYISLSILIFIKLIFMLLSVIF